MCNLKPFVLLIAVWMLVEQSLSQRREFKFQQDEYKIEFERIELDHYNKKHIKFAKFVTFKYNRTTTAVNSSAMYNTAVGNAVEVVVQAYKFLSNEYRIFPLRFEVNMCDAIKNNLIGAADMLKCGNFTGCSIRKNINYYFCNWLIDETQFPPLLPNGKYMTNLSLLYSGEDVGAVLVYYTVYRPILIP